MAAVEQLRFAVEGGREVSALLWRPAKSRRLLVLAHGAGAGMSHPFMEKLAGELAGVGVATLRYQFPYMEQRRRVPDTPAVLTATVVAAVHAAAEAAPGWGSRIGVLWLSAAPAQPTGNETSGAPCEGHGADAVPAGNARRTCGSHVVASGLREARAAGEVARH